MRGFELDLETGDVKLENGRLCLVQGDDLTAQNLSRLLGTNQGEWWLNTQQGINFKAILAKEKNPDRIRSEVQKALLQLDESLVLDDFYCEGQNRKLEIRFTVKKQTGGTFPVRAEWG